jgi:putative transposase
MVKKCLSRMSGKLSRTVLRRGKGSNPFSLVDYTSKEFAEVITEYGIKHSFSKKGCPYDNACIESFHAILKKEEVYLNKYRNFKEAEVKLFDFIEGWYNRNRLHSSLGYKTPQEVENDYTP